MIQKKIVPLKVVGGLDAFVAVMMESKDSSVVQFASVFERFWDRIKEVDVPVTYDWLRDAFAAVRLQIEPEGVSLTSRDLPYVSQEFDVDGPFTVVHERSERFLVRFDFDGDDVTLTLGHVDPIILSSWVASTEIDSSFWTTLDEGHAPVLQEVCGAADAR